MIHSNETMFVQVLKKDVSHCRFCTKDDNDIRGSESDVTKLCMQKNQGLTSVSNDLAEFKQNKNAIRLCNSTQ